MISIKCVRVFSFRKFKKVQYEDDQHQEAD